MVAGRAQAAHHPEMVRFGALLRPAWHKSPSVIKTRTRVFVCKYLCKQFVQPAARHVAWPLTAWSAHHAHQRRRGAQPVRHAPATDCNWAESCSRWRYIYSCQLHQGLIVYRHAHQGSRLLNSLHLSALRQRSGLVRAAAATCWRPIVTLVRPHMMMPQSFRQQVDSPYRRSLWCSS